MESNPLRALFGVSSPRPGEQRVAPQPTEPTENENVCFEIPSSMIEKLLANPFVGDGRKHPDEHLIYVDEVCGLFKLVVGTDLDFMSSYSMKKGFDHFRGYEKYGLWKICAF